MDLAMETRNQQSAQPNATEVGLILVHGIGEQGRFEHLDIHIRGIIGGFKRSGVPVTVEIMSADSAAFHSAQDTWRSGPEASLRILVEHDGRNTTINVHEVWWADINEPYSVMKQLRFWVWGLSVWRYPSRLHGRPATRPFVVQPGLGGIWTENLVRARLFAIGCIFLMGSLTIGVVTVLGKRLLNLNAFSLVKTFVNYLSSVKLYNQSARGGAGVGSNADFLDTIGEPPRDSIRRRMIRTICDVACREKPYERWYILAHSQGSVVAFNGLMEPGAGWPGYLDETRLRKLRSAKLVHTGSADKHDMIPPRPLWSGNGEAVLRAELFKNFCGLLTYGSPLEKFAAIWPGCITVYDEPAFKPETQWINIFDPVDPVSGVIRTWSALGPDICPRVLNIGYASSDMLLAGHTKYMTCPYAAGPKDPYGQRLADDVSAWLLGDTHQFSSVPTGPRFFAPGNRRASLRRYAGLVQWVTVFLLMTALAALLVPIYLGLIHVLYPAAWTQPRASFWHWYGALIVLTVLTTFAFGIASWRPQPKETRPPNQRM